MRILVLTRPLTSLVIRGPAPNARVRLGAKAPADSLSETLAALVRCRASPPIVIIRNGKGLEKDLYQAKRKCLPGMCFSRTFRVACGRTVLPEEIAPPMSILPKHNKLGFACAEADDIGVSIPARLAEEINAKKAHARLDDGPMLG